MESSIDKDLLFTLNGETHTIKNPYNLKTDNFGGNGKVFEIPLKSGEKIAVKVFTRKDKKERYERFLREVNFMKNSCNSGSNQDWKKYLVKILASNTPEFEKLTDGEEYAWIAMPLYSPWDNSDNGNPITKNGLNKCVLALTDIAESICFIHKKGKAHRDIKATNILMNKDGRWVLSDYGLILGENDERITGSNESLSDNWGPPEMRNPNLYKHLTSESAVSLFQKSDVYLFGKLCWNIIVNKQCFCGGFLDSLYPLNQFLKKCGDLPVFPLIELMRQCIKEDSSARCNIEDVFEYLDQEKKMLSYSDDSNLVLKCVTKQKFFGLIQKRKPQMILYKDASAIGEFLKIPLYSSVFSLEDPNGAEVLSQVSSSICKSNDSYCFKYQNFSLFFNPVSLEITDNNSSMSAIVICGDCQRILRKISSYNGGRLGNCSIDEGYSLHFTISGDYSLQRL